MQAARIPFSERYVPWHSRNKVKSNFQFPDNQKRRAVRMVLHVPVKSKLDLEFETRLKTRLENSILSSAPRAWLNLLPPTPRKRSSARIHNAA